MKVKKLSLSRSVSPAKSILSVVGLTALSFLNVLKPVNAASLNCGSGEHWVDTCPSGFNDFSTSLIINIGLGSHNRPDFTSELSGITQIFRGNPTDAIISDPLLGNVGRTDGHLDVLKTEFVNLTLTGSTPFRPEITVISGDGIPNLTPPPNDPTLPYKSLYSAGAIFERSDNPALADSFFKAFVEIGGTPAEGPLRNKEPITIRAVQPLTGWPFGSPSNRVDYAGTDITNLYEAGPDGEFWTGDERQFARLVPDDSGRSLIFSIIPVSVPEPSTQFSSVLGGLAMMFGFVRKKPSRGSAKY